MDDCLDYFQQALQYPGSVPKWNEWWRDHAELVRRSFHRADYLRLKFRKLAAARRILERMGIAVPIDRQNVWEQTHCEVCGEELFKAMPGKTTAEEIAAFGARVGNEVIQRDQWIHPGVYCPSGCTAILVNIRRPWAEDLCRTGMAD